MGDNIAGLGDNIAGLVEQVKLLDLWSIQLSTGLPIYETLETLGKEFPSYGVLEDIIKSVRGGGNVYKKMNLMVFHPIVPALAELGEENGTLDATLATASGLLEKEVRLRTGIGKERPEDTDRILFYYHLAALIDAGIDAEAPLTSSLRTIAKYANYPPRSRDSAVNHILEGIARYVEAGQSLAEALSNFPAYFPPAAISIVKAGAARGELGAAIKSYAHYLERAMELDALPK